MSASNVIAIGNFDGVHIGHQAILGRARRLADQHGAPLTALTIEPHPAALLRPGNEPPRINSVEQKVQRLEKAGADSVCVLEATADLLDLSPQAFLEQVVDQHHPRVIVEGEDFRFGKGRGGDVSTLRAHGRRLGYETAIEGPVEVVLTDLLTAPVSSTLIRWLIGHGRVADAQRCLGDPFELAGQVTIGDRRGRTMGFPTANLDPNDLNLLPADGVYAGLVQLPSGAAHVAAISVGARPTFDGGGKCVEAHLLDFQDDLYGQRIIVQFTRWLRDQCVFPNGQALCEQLHRDITRTRELHGQGCLEVPAASCKAAAG